MSIADILGCIRFP